MKWYGTHLRVKFPTYNVICLWDDNHLVMGKVKSSPYFETRYLLVRFELKLNMKLNVDL